MNTASQNLPHHLQLLREKMLHPADYEFAVSYFLEEFAGDLGFLRQSQPDEARPLLAVLKEIARRALGGPVAFDESKVFHLGGHGFYHGSAITPARVILFFYFQDADTGVAAFIPQGRGTTEVARFRVTAGLPDPRQN
jgi:hypothetical protein